MRIDKQFFFFIGNKMKTITTQANKSLIDRLRGRTSVLHTLILLLLAAPSIKESRAILTLTLVVLLFSSTGR
jgi:hypothetical protein